LLPPLFGVPNWFYSLWWYKDYRCSCTKDLAKAKKYSLIIDFLLRKILDRSFFIIFILINYFMID